MPEIGLSSVNLALSRKSFLGIQYCGKKRCSQTSKAEVVSKMVWPFRRPRTRLPVERVFTGKGEVLEGLKSLEASSVILGCVRL